jgi:hypothetical protein
MSSKYRAAHLEEVRAQQRQYQAAKRARAKEGGDPNATGEVHSDEPQQ